MNTIQLIFLSIVLSVTWSTTTDAFLGQHRLYERKGENAYKIQNYKDAKTQFSKSFSLNPESGPTIFNLGNTFYRNNEFEKAEEAYWKSINYINETDKSKAYYNLGTLKYQQEKFGDAIQLYIKSIEKDRDNIQAKKALELAQIKQTEQQQKKQQEQDEQEKKAQDKDNEEKDNKNKDNSDETEIEEKTEKDAQKTENEVAQLLNAAEKREEEARKTMTQNKTKQKRWVEKEW